MLTPALAPESAWRRAAAPTLPAGASGPCPCVGREPGPHSPSLLLQRLDPSAVRKLSPTEVGVPVPRSGSVAALRLQNGHASPKLHSGHCGTPSRKALGLQHTPLPPRAAQSPASSSAGRRASWDRGAPLSTSPKLLAAAPTNGHGPKLGSGPASPEPSSSSDPAKAPLAPASSSPQGADSGPGAREDPKASKPRATLSASTGPELPSFMSPPPAKKLALSAKKVGVGAG